MGNNNCCLRSSSLPVLKPLKSTQISEKTQEDILLADHKFRYQPGDYKGKGPIGEVKECVCMKTLDFYAEKRIFYDLEHYKELFEILEKHLLSKNWIKMINFKEIYPLESSIIVVSELCTGGSLEKLLEDMNKFDERTVKIIVKQILEGLFELNSENRFHGNIKPSNIMFEKNGEIKLTDFYDIPKNFIYDQENYTLFYKKNVGFLAPETILSNKKTYKSDIWTLGCIIINMLTGKNPWFNTDLNELGVSKRIYEGKMPDLPGNISVKCLDFLKKMLVFDVDTRFDAKSLLEEEFLNEIPEINDGEERKSLKILFTKKKQEINAKSILYNAIAKKINLKKY